MQLNALNRRATYSRCHKSPNVNTPSLKSIFKVKPGTGHERRRSEKTLLVFQIVDFKNSLRCKVSSTTEATCCDVMPIREAWLILTSDWRVDRGQALLAESVRSSRKRRLRRAITHLNPLPIIRAEGPDQRRSRKRDGKPS